ncbi:serine protease [Actibacterium sp. XHP0104]|uniref:serine protease n=1 Tax=Actibacterium sp. XHP0104 TaxID=2984335 RepID=UPI0021E8D89E|nr:serine protease [Actibacterium sp. XHP0104]MCV2882565.1 serine protease [Actibacterium sp. XHP0104]
MRKVISLVILVMIWALPAAAQDRVWLQIEAQPTLREAQEAARGYAATLDDVAGFQLRSGWYAIALGPYTADEAPALLQQLRRSGQVPGDAYVADGGNFRQQFWPAGNANMAAAQPVEQPAAPDQPSLSVRPVTDETPVEARRSEAQLSREERMLLQEALKWEGFYNSAIDGAFGRGTRASMADYQAARGYEATGVLTSRQRAELVETYQAQFAALGLATVDAPEAGIRITLPAGMVAFSRFEPPFAHYDSTGDSGVRVLLISQTGDQDTLHALYDVMQTLEIVPLEGARERNREDFVLTGQNDSLQSYTYAALSDGMVKGFTLVWRPEDEKLMSHAAQVMRDSFAPYGGALDPMLGQGSADQTPDLMSGLEIRRPQVTRSGFYVDGAGTVLTTLDGLAQCQRITIGDDTEAQISGSDSTLGLAVLKPVQRLAPLRHAAFQTGIPRLQSEVAVAGYSYGDTLGLPVLTYGTLADLRGLAGEETVNRLEIETLPGDTGGPVLDVSGAVLGLLLPQGGGDGRVLPQAVNFAAPVTVIAEFLSSNGIEMAASDSTATALAPVDLAAQASDMTVLVSCWN